jgi:hypothetical protein
LIIMGSSLTAKIVGAIAATLAAELTDKAFDWIGAREEIARLPREIIKAVAAVVAALLAEDILGRSNASMLFGDDNSASVNDTPVTFDRAA